MSNDNEEKVNFEESEKQRLRAEIAGLNEETLSHIREWAAKDEKALIGLLCRLTLGITDKDCGGFSDEKFETLRKNYSDMAELIFHQLNDEKIPPSLDGYISFTDWIKNNAPSPRRLFPQDINSPNIDRIASSYFLDSEYDFGIALHWAFELVYHGMPIYMFDSASNVYQMVAAESADYVFMFRLGKEYLDIRTGMFPAWIKKYYFKQSDQEAHSIFFRGEPPDENGIDALRNAYRRYLFPNFEENPSEQSRKINSASYTRLMQAISNFPAQYPHYRVSPPKLDNDVRPWMQEQGYATTDAERRVFGSIIAEHFKLSS